MSTSEWIEDEFGAVRLGDERLNERLRLLLARKWQHPQRAFSAACQGRAEIEAASRFFDHDHVSEDKILAPHRAAIVERIRQGGDRRVLLVQDTMELDFSTHEKLQGAGPLSSQDRRGFFAHNLLVVTPERVPLGLWHTFLYARDDAEHGKAAERKDRPIEQKESFRWLEGFREACALAGLVPGCEVLCLGDRESDIYELFVEYAQRRAQGLPVAELLIRSKEDRGVEPGAEALVLPGAAPAAGETTAAPNPSVAAAPAEKPAPPRIRARLAAAPVLGTVKFPLPAATHDRKVKGSTRRITRSARVVEQELRAIPLRLRPPYRSAKAGGALPAVAMFVVEARELHPPAGEEPLVWVLLTTLSVSSFEQAGALLELYLCRWEIELLHRVVKSGCRVEQIQQRFDFRIRPVIVLYLVVAWRLLYVMRLGRACPDLPCELVFDESEWKPVVVVLRGRAALAHQPTLGEMVGMVGELGGFVPRKNDPQPGMKSMWIGFMRVADFARCWECFGPPATDTG
ncbi:MAG: IS4 family transposase [Opitutaceae bacterium]|nr:IS4 family transposase [Opitutaceae bacterium]